MMGDWIIVGLTPLSSTLLGHSQAAGLSLTEGPAWISQLLDKQNLFAVSLFPYLGFLWFMTRSGQTPRLALIGFYVLLLFVAITIPVGLYAEKTLGTSLANVDPLHGGAEFFLTLSNILVVLGFRQAVMRRRQQPTSTPLESSPEA